MSTLRYQFPVLHSYETLQPDTDITDSSHSVLSQDQRSGEDVPSSRQAKTRLRYPPPLPRQANVGFCDFFESPFPCSRPWAAYRLTTPRWLKEIHFHIHAIVK